MKFREEVFAKIFTYITVILLLGIVLFEAIKLQDERNARKEAEHALVDTQESLQAVTKTNTSLKQENAQLEAFAVKWRPYAAFVENEEVLALQTDLFSRPDLIPQEAIEEIAKKAEEQEEGTIKQNEDAREDSEEEPLLEFTFDNPNGENIFLPLNAGEGRDLSCLIYTVAYETKGDAATIELLYETGFTNQESTMETDENGEIVWNCIAYNIGEGWAAAIKEE